MNSMLLLPDWYLMMMVEREKTIVRVLLNLRVVVVADGDDDDQIVMPQLVAYHQNIVEVNLVLNSYCCQSLMLSLLKVVVRLVLVPLLWSLMKKRKMNVKDQLRLLEVHQSRNISIMD